jgi:hypothetical protein
MMERLSFYISAFFILTTFLTIVFFIYAIKRGAFSSTPAKLLGFLIPFWLLFQATLAISGFYLKTDSTPPRLALFAVLPTLITILLLFIFARKSLIERLPLRALTLLHIIRIPVELSLFWLFQNGLVPQLMTFEGRNFDILSGITAPVIFWLAFRNGKPNRPLLIVWNVFALILLINIVANAFLSIPSSFQQFAFEQPNRAVLYFPFIWLPSLVVPIVLFSHLASLYQLLKSAPKLNQISPV